MRPVQDSPWQVSLLGAGPCRRSPGVALVTPRPHECRSKEQWASGYRIDSEDGDRGSPR